MKEVFERFISEKSLSPFSSLKTTVRKEGESIFKTTDSKTIFTKVLANLSSSFVFRETSNLWNIFNFCENFTQVQRRQTFFQSIAKGDNTFLKNLSAPKQAWSPEYEIVVVTEDESTFVELQKLSCPVQFIVSENDLSDLERYDVVQVIDCEMFSGVLERLPQSVFIESLADVYLERYLEELSGWRKNLVTLKDNAVSLDIKEIVDFLLPLFSLIDSKAREQLTVESAEKVLEDINTTINEKIRDLTLSGDTLVSVLSEGKLPDAFQKIIEDALDKSGLPHEIFDFKIPVQLDYTELERYIQRENASEFTSLSEEIKRNAGYLKRIPEKLAKLQSLLLIEDFCLGVSKYLGSQVVYPTESSDVTLGSVSNLFLDDAQPVSFSLNDFNRCSILTGANSGGKTTLLEHVLQIISLFHLGLPVLGTGTVSIPLFSDVYYFAKNKGSASRGAFETLLTQMSKIKPGKKTLVLADEIEAVTEPGIAGRIIAATCDYYIQQSCYLIVATHLGLEIQGFLPSGARIDGIEAKGLDSEFNLIVDHNPVLGRLAHSTPELIVDRMASHFGDEYFLFLQDRLKKEDRGF